MSLLTFCVSFTLFRRQWRRLFSHPQFFRGTSGRFLHIVGNSSPTTADDSSFLYLSVAEFNALQELAQETLRRPTFTNNLTTDSITNPPPHPVVASDTTSANPNRVYPIVTAPYIRTHLPKILRITTLFHFSTLCLYYVYICLPTPYSSSSMMPSDAYPRFFSPILAYPASWHVSVPIVLLFLLLISSYFVLPNGACPCLNDSVAV